MVLAQGGNYVVEGSLANYGPPAKVYLQYQDKNKTTLDSTTLQNGKFRFEGKIESDLVTADLMFNPKGTGVSYDDSKGFYLENGTVTINSTNTLRDAVINGTETNNDQAKLNELQKALKPYYVRLDEKIKGSSDLEKQSDSYRKEISELTKDVVQRAAAINKAFIQDNPDSYVSLLYLRTASASGDYSELAPLYDGLSARIKQSERGKDAAKLLMRLKTIAFGAIAPDFTEPDTLGKMISLSSFRGKYVLVDFWASWCNPCRQENPNLVKAFNRYKERNFTIIGVSLDGPDGNANWHAAIRKDALPWTQVSELKDWEDQAAILYAINGVPQNFLLDPNGKVIAKNLRGDDLENKLEEIFGKI